MMNHLCPSLCLLAQETLSNSDPTIDWSELLQAGGGIGFFILFLSLVVGAFVIQQFLYLRVDNLAPIAMEEDLRKLITQKQIQQASLICQENPCFLGHVVLTGLSEIDLDYQQVEKALEEGAAEQAARLFRRLEYINLIGTLAPMLGLLGTVWGMIQAFAQFAAKSNPQVSELAPGIYNALVTTLLGLGVAIPALAAYGFLRNRADELIAEASMSAERTFSGYKRARFKRLKPASVTPAVETISLPVDMQPMPEAENAG